MMDQNRFVGLQWKLSIVYLLVGTLSVLTVAAGFFISTALGLGSAPALWVGIGAGLIVGVAGSFFGFVVARLIKLRLWDAGDFAGRIAMGDLQVRLPAESADEIGWLEEQLNRMALHLEQAVGNLHLLAEQNRMLAEEAGRGAALEERARLARDLHDTVNQQLFVLTMRTAAARRRLESIGGKAAEIVPELALLEDLAREAHAQTRDLILQLRPTTLDQQGVGPALHEYVRAVATKEGWECAGDIDLSVHLKGPRGECLFRVAQEALNNISKHSGAGTLTVDLSQTEDGILLRIRDDGKGFDLRTDVGPTAVGLLGIQERVAAVGGLLRVTSTPGQGTEVSVLLPLSEGEQT